MNRAYSRRHADLQPPRIRERDLKMGTALANQRSQGMGAIALDPPRPAPLLTRLSRVLALAGLEATSMGLACWTLASGHGLPAFVRDNTLDPA
jgi:hypothetical protein